MYGTFEPLSGYLIVEQVDDRQSDAGQGSTLILVFDTWEHAFYWKPNASDPSSSWMRPSDRRVDSAARERPSAAGGRAQRSLLMALPAIGPMRTRPTWRVRWPVQ